MTAQQRLDKLNNNIQEIEKATTGKVVYYAWQGGIYKSHITGITYNAERGIIYYDLADGGTYNDITMAVYDTLEEAAKALWGIE